MTAFLSCLVVTLHTNTQITIHTQAWWQLTVAITIAMRKATRLLLHSSRRVNRKQLLFRWILRLEILHDAESSELLLRRSRNKQHRSCNNSRTNSSIFPARRIHEDLHDTKSYWRNKGSVTSICCKDCMLPSNAVLESHISTTCRKWVSRRIDKILTETEHNDGTPRTRPFAHIWFCGVRDFHLY